MLTPEAARHFRGGVDRRLECARSRSHPRFPDLNFELIDVLTGAQSVAINYFGRGRRHACEVFFLNAQGKVMRAAAHYRD